MTVPDQSAVVVPPIEPNQKASSSATQNDVNPDVSSSTHALGAISKTIGTGDNAKNSIIWMTITWSFYIASTITVFLFISLWVAYYNKNASEILELKKYVLSVWSIFTPIITLALGYAFGRNETK